MARERIEIRAVSPDEVLTEQEALDVSSYRPFRAPYEGVEEPLYSYALARARLRKVFVGPLLKAPLLIETPQGVGVVWHILGKSVRVVLGQKESTRAVVLDERLTFLTLEEYTKSRLCLDHVVITLPSWSR